MKATEYAGQVMRAVRWSAIAFVGIFIPGYLLSDMLWLKVVASPVGPSASVLYRLGAIGVYYLSTYPALLLAVMVYAPLIGLLSCWMRGPWLVVASIAIASVIPILTIILSIDRSMLDEWPAAVVATVSFGGFCGQMLRRRS